MLLHSCRLTLNFKDFECSKNKSSGHSEIFKLVCICLPFSLQFEDSKILLTLIKKLPVVRYLTESKSFLSFSVFLSIIHTLKALEIQRKQEKSNWMIWLCHFCSLPGLLFLRSLKISLHQKIAKKYRKLTQLGFFAILTTLRAFWSKKTAIFLKKRIFFPFLQICPDS